ncbi:30S ribosomal protein S12 methylthiotransferase RimO [bacterium]|nr:30S ribosomal protein S12 methylthiotransferase RimO [candidate division CSSED10-310 bacterium]
MKPPLSVAMISLGCVKNTVDAEYILGTLINEGFQITSHPENAHIIIINTCGFLESARDESFEIVKEMNQYRQSGRLMKLVVTGCMADVDRTMFAENNLRVDLFVSPFALDKISKLLLKNSVNATTLNQFIPPYTVHAATRCFVTPPSYAYVKLADGCNHHCSYCRIPFIRGSYRSKLPEDVISEVTSLVDIGRKEINLISQDTGQYGKDLHTSVDLTRLIRQLDNISNLVWLRLLYLYPSTISRRLLETIAQSRTVCHYLDIPLQHVNASILKKMNRSGNPLKIRQMIDEIREIIPDCAIRSTVMVGFPGEDNNAFSELRDFVAEEMIDHLGVFIFSPEPNTPAKCFYKAVDNETALQRRDELLSLQQKISTKRHKSLKNTIMTVIIDGPDQQNPGCSLGRTEYQAPDVDPVVHVVGEIPAGTLMPVMIAKTEAYDLWAHPIPAGSEDETV